MPKDREILSAAAMSHALARIASQIVERNGGVDEVALVGIRSRGVPLAERIAQKLEKTEGRAVPVGALDITLHRDDLLASGLQPVVRSTEIPFEVEAKVIVLVDDVLFTGRTVRSALDALVALGRPRKIQLAALLDRGGRELPIAADFVGRAVDVGAGEEVRVQLKEIDGQDRVTVGPKETR